ncbi:MAG TPA: hypothetical protein VF157_01925, partial [Chloroflexota bacterium]
PSADIYGLGVVLYQMLTGRVPFEADNPIAAAVRSQREDPRPPSELAQIPAWLDGVVLRALARDPAARYATADELAVDLAEGRESRPLGPQPEGGDTVRWRPIGGPNARTAARSYRRAAPPASMPSHSRLPSPQSTTPSPRRRILWLLPLVVLALIATAIALAATHAPGQPGSVGTATPKAPPQSAPNLLSNGGLASNGEQPNGWRLQVFGGSGQPVRHWMPGGPSSGDREITLEASSATDSAWISNDVKVQAGTRLTLSGYIQTRNVPQDGPGAALWIVCQGGGSATSQALRGSTGWTQVQAQGTAPAGAETCNAALRLGAPGKPTTGTAEFSRLALVAG